MTTLLVIGLDARATPQQVDAIRDQLEDLHPELNFVVIAGVTALAVADTGSEQ